MCSSFFSPQHNVVKSFLALDILRKANQMEAAGRDVIHMEIGQPCAPTPPSILASIRTIIDKGRIGYTEALGMPQLRERIAHHYSETYGLDIAPNRVVITTGSSTAFTLAFLSAFRAGQRLVLPTPGYPAYRNIMIALGLEPVDAPSTAQTNWTLTATQLDEIHAKQSVAGAMIASPNNPSGTIIAPDKLAALASLCDQKGIQLISDEIYHGLVYGCDNICALSYSPSVIVINSFSKYYCMSGLRIGWMIVPEVLVRPIEQLAQSLFISVPELSQHAALAAFDVKEELEAIKDGYARNRAFLLKTLPEIGFDEILPADGAFYLYASTKQFCDDSLPFATRMLDETGVAATPGIDFDHQRGHNYMRFSYAGSYDDMQRAMERLAAWLPKS